MTDEPLRTSSISGQPADDSLGGQPKSADGRSPSEFVDSGLPESTPAETIAAAPSSPVIPAPSPSSMPTDADTPMGAVDQTELVVEEEEENEGVRVEPIEEVAADAEEGLERDWYILKVQSNREESIRDGLQRRVAVAGLDRFFGEIIVPTEDVAEFKNGKKRVSKRKLYPGYIMVNMAINDDTWFLVRETPGIGDFTGSAGKPTPMLTQEVDRIVKARRTEDEGGEPVKTAIPFKISDRVRIKEGTFENFEGDVDAIDEANGRVTVMINIFGRSTPVELEHWQVESV